MTGQASPGSREVREFVDDSLVLRIATRSPQGNPDLIPLFFVRWRGRYYMTPRSENPVVRDLERDPAVVLLFDGESGHQEGSVLRIRGRARFLTEKATVRPVTLRMARRYYLAPGGFWNALRNVRLFGVRARYYRERTGESGVIEVVPESAEFLAVP